MSGYREVFGSDVPNDGVYLELRNPNGEIVACVFRSDTDGHFEVHEGPANAPAEIISAFVTRAKLALEARAQE